MTRSRRIAIAFITTVLIAPALLIAAYVLVLPKEHHLTYASVSNEGNSILGAITKELSTFAVHSWTTCPDFGWPESAIGFVVNAYGSPSDEPQLKSLIESLSKSGCDVNAYSKHGYTPLMNASVISSEALANDLLRLGADPQLKSKSTGRLAGLTAAQIASRKR